MGKAYLDWGWNILISLFSVMVPYSIDSLGRSAKTYEQPFRPYSPDDPDANEALGKEDFTMGKFTRNRDVILMGE